ncbi:hypothetical protein B0H14DRAFT_3573764, partial [Mycena olivaceomarginata]
LAQFTHSNVHRLLAIRVVYRDLSAVSISLVCSHDFVHRPRPEAWPTSHVSARRGTVSVIVVDGMGSMYTLLTVSFDGSNKHIIPLKLPAYESLTGLTTQTLVGCQLGVAAPTLDFLIHWLVEGDALVDLQSLNLVWAPETTWHIQRLINTCPASLQEFFLSMRHDPEAYPTTLGHGESAANTAAVPPTPPLCRPQVPPSSV